MLRALILTILLSMNLSAYAASAGDLLGALMGKSSRQGHGASVDETLENISTQMNRKMPLMVDAETRLDRVSAEPGQHLKYHYTLIAVRASDVNTVDFHKQLAPRLKSRLCGSEMENFLKQGVTVSYFYRSQDGRALGGAQFGPGACAFKT